MADWSDISDLWWLQPRGQQRDSARGLALGAQVAQNRQENVWREKQAQVLMDQRRAAMESREAQVRGVTEISSYLSRVAQNNAWTEPQALAGFYELTAKHPGALTAEQLTSIVDKNFTAAQERQQKAQDALRTTAITELTAADKYEQIADQMESLGAMDEDMAKQASNLRQRAVLLRGRQLASTEIIESTPEGGFKITRGPAVAAKPGELTTATRTKRQQDLMGYADVAETLAYINKNKDVSDFGVRGQFKELYARVAGQLGVPVPEGTISTRTAVNTLRAALVKSLRSDSNIAEGERKMLEKSIPSIADFTESFATATDKLNEAVRNIWGRSAKAAEDLQMPVPPWVVPPDKLREQFRAGRYGDPSSQAAQDAFVRDLRRYHGFD